MTNLRSDARPTGKVAIAGQGHVGPPKIADERCAVIEDGSGPWRSPPGREFVAAALKGSLHQKKEVIHRHHKVRWSGVALDDSEYWPGPSHCHFG